LIPAFGAAFPDGKRGTIDRRFSRCLRARSLASDFQLVFLASDFMSCHVTRHRPSRGSIVYKETAG
jgi:hypothetical protein